MHRLERENRRIGEQGGFRFHARFERVQLFFEDNISGAVRHPPVHQVAYFEAADARANFHHLAHQP